MRQRRPGRLRCRQSTVNSRRIIGGDAIYLHDDDYITVIIILRIRLLAYWKLPISFAHFENNKLRGTYDWIQHLLNVAHKSMELRRGCLMLAATLMMTIEFELSRVLLESRGGAIE